MMTLLTPYPITPVANFIGLVLALLPLVSQVRKLSLAVWGYGIWIALSAFQSFINEIVWRRNVNIVIPVWCDIITKLQIGTNTGTRTCALVICIHLYKITRLRPPVESTKWQRRKFILWDLFLILCVPFITMAFMIVVQPLRFEIIEEEGCAVVSYSYVAYFQYAPSILASFGCAILAPLTLRTFFRHRKEMNEFLSNSRNITHNKYTRLMVIACLDTAFNLPVEIGVVIMQILSGKGDSFNQSYTGWKHVHDIGDLPGFPINASLSVIYQDPYSVWSTAGWYTIFLVKWNEWLYVVHAIMFFSVFGTAPEMRRYYRAIFWFIPERLGWKERHDSNPEASPDTSPGIVFASNPSLRTPAGPSAKRRGSLSFLETTEVSAVVTPLASARAPDGLELESGSRAQTLGHGIEATSVVEEGKADSKE